MSRNVGENRSGAGASEEMRPRERWIDRGWYLVSDFEETNSARFEETLELARSLDDFLELCDEQGRIVYRNFFRAGNLHTFGELYRRIGKWKKTKIFICGEEVRGALPAGVLCMMETRCSYREEGIPDYLGCSKAPILLRLLGPEPTPPEGRAPYWFEFSSYTGRYFAVSKERLRARYLQTVSRPKWRGCPLFQGTRDLALIDRLPDRLFPGDRELPWLLYDPERGSLDTDFLHSGVTQGHLPWPTDPERYDDFIRGLFSPGGAGRGG